MENPISYERVVEIRSPYQIIEEKLPYLAKIYRAAYDNAPLSNPSVFYPRKTLLRMLSYLLFKLPFLKTKKGEFLTKMNGKKYICTLIDIQANFFEEDVAKISPLFETSVNTFDKLKTLAEKQRSAFYDILGDHTPDIETKLKVFYENLASNTEINACRVSLEESRNKLSIFLDKAIDLFQRTKKSHYLYSNLDEAIDKTIKMLDMIDTAHAQVDQISALLNYASFVEEEVTKKLRLKREEIGELMDQEKTKIFITQITILHNMSEVYRKRSGNTADCKPIPFLTMRFIALLEMQIAKEQQPRQTTSFRS